MCADWHDGVAIGDQALNICGSVDGGHYDPQFGILDRDTYRVAVGGDGELLVEITGDPELSMFSVYVRLFDTAAAPALLAQGQLVAPHGAFLAKVPPGDIDVVVEARASSDIAGSLPYRVRLLPEPATICPPATGSVYTEAHDGDDMTGNDVALVDFSKSTITPGPGTAEATGLTIDPGLPAAITGVAGSIGRGDQYLDRDTFAVTTGEASNELAVRVDWPDTTLDLDAIVFDESLKPLARLTRASTTEHEFQFVGVEPHTTYWLWVGRFAMPPGPASEPYNITVCGNSFY